VAPLHAAVGVQTHDRRVLAAVAVRRARDQDLAVDLQRHRAGDVVWSAAIGLAEVGIQATVPVQARDHDIAAAGTHAGAVADHDCMSVGLQRDGATFVAARTQVEADEAVGAAVGTGGGVECAVSIEALDHDVGTSRSARGRPASVEVPHHSALTASKKVQPRPCEILILDRPS
jgi:hypothetical protein